MKAKLKKLQEIKDQLAVLEAERKKLQEQLSEAMGDDSVDFCVGEQKFKATCVRSETVKIDEEALATALGKKVWEQITVRKLDNKLLEAKVALGEIPVELVSDHSTIVPRKPYIKTTAQKS